MAMAAAYPVDIGLDYPVKVARWRPLVHWLLVIPHWIVLYVLEIVSSVLWIVSFVAILVTGNIPETIFDFQAMVFRYQWRVTSYWAFTREPYPPFQFELTPADPGGDPATLQIARPASLSRWKIFLKWLFAIPHYLVLAVLGIASFVVLIIAFFAVIITGEWPEGLRNFFVGYFRWTYRVNAYVFLLTDDYPPFSLT
jgi:uncharacterized protein DUF4389